MVKYADSIDAKDRQSPLMAGPSRKLPYTGDTDYSLLVQAGAGQEIDVSHEACFCSLAPIAGSVMDLQNGSPWTRGSR